MRPGSWGGVTVWLLSCGEACVLGVGVFGGVEGVCALRGEACVCEEDCLGARSQEPARVEGREEGVGGHVWQSSLGRCGPQLSPWHSTWDRAPAALTQGARAMLHPTHMPGPS